MPKKETKMEITIDKIFYLAIAYFIIGFLTIALNFYILGFVNIAIMFGSLDWFFIGILLIVFNILKMKYLKLAKIEIIIFVIGLIFIIIPFLSGLFAYWYVISS